MIVDRRRRDGRFCVGHTNLIQTPNDVAGGVEAVDGRLLMFIDEKSARGVCTRRQRFDQLRLRCGSKRRIDNVEVVEFTVLDFQRDHPGFVEWNGADGDVCDEDGGLRQRLARLF